MVVSGTKNGLIFTTEDNILVSYYEEIALWSCHFGFIAKANIIRHFISFHFISFHFISYVLYYEIDII